jgi:hypothetical protein
MALAEATRAGVEDELREAMLTGRPVDWRTGDATADDPAHGAGWHAQRTVPGSTAGQAAHRHGGPALAAGAAAGARVVGQLDLEGATRTNPDGYALDLQELRAGVLLLRDLNEPPELVDFTHAQVGALVDAPTG